MNKNERMYQKIRIHGEALKRLFIMPPDKDWGGYGILAPDFREN